MTASVLIVNTNITRPPVSPVGLEYVGEALREAGIQIRTLDLAFEPEWKISMTSCLADIQPVIIGLSVRNTDDCCFATGRSFLPWIKEVVDEIRSLTDAFIVLGGGGFSVMPEATLDFTKADIGIAGDGEETIVSLVRSFLEGGDIYRLPNLVYQSDNSIIGNPRANVDSKYLPLPRRRLFDNRRYQEEGAMVGVETKRGCPQQCIFCADPLAKGKTARLRPPSMVVEEVRDLLIQGVSWLYFCDSEFNLPVEHAKEICRALIQAGLGDRIRWYCYCSPVPFDHELAVLMKKAGCSGINFGVDSLCDEQLQILKRSHRLDDIENMARILRDTETNYMVDLLVGGPGETEETIKASVEHAKRLDIPLVGIAAGLRIYTGTPLSRAISKGSINGKLYPGPDPEPDEPLFYISPYLGNDISGIIDRFVAGDRRFLLLTSPDDEGSYNYADDHVLSQLINDGARGAYWDILRRNRKQ